MGTYHKWIARSAVPVLLALAFQSPGSHALAQHAGQKNLPEFYIQAHSTPAVVARTGVAVLELDPRLAEVARQRLRQALAEQGLEFAATKPVGFPRAGKVQDLLQSVWALEYNTERPFTEVRAQIQSWILTPGDEEVKSGVWGIQPGFEGENDQSPVFFRPAHVVVMLDSHMPFDRVTDSLTPLGGLTVTTDSIPQSAFVRHLWRRVTLRVDRDIDLFRALDSLRVRPWVRAVSPVLPDWSNLLPIIPRVALMRELAAGTLRKLRPLELVVVAQTCRVDGPEAAEEVARSTMQGVDSLGRIGVRIEISEPFESLESTLIDWNSAIISHQAQGDRVIVVAMLPVKWLAVCTALSSVVNIYPHREIGGQD